jgi:hypothetical protein
MVNGFGDGDVGMTRSLLLLLVLWRPGSWMQEQKLVPD